MIFKSEKWHRINQLLYHIKKKKKRKKSTKQTNKEKEKTKIRERKNRQVAMSNVYKN